MSRKKHLSIQIKGIEWKVYFQQDSTFQKSHGDCEAITYPDDREMYFNMRNFYSGYVAHELVHSFVASTNTEHSSLDKDQAEELICALYQHHHLEFNKLIFEIVDFVLKNKIR